MKETSELPRPNEIQQQNPLKRAHTHTHTHTHTAADLSALTSSHVIPPPSYPRLKHALKSTLEPDRETTSDCKQACYYGPAAI